MRFLEWVGKNASLVGAKIAKLSTTRRRSLGHSLGSSGIIAATAAARRCVSCRTRQVLMPAGPAQVLVYLSVVKVWPLLSVLECANHVCVGSGGGGLPHGRSSHA